MATEEPSEEAVTEGWSVKIMPVAKHTASGSAQPWARARAPGHHRNASGVSQRHE